jgi:elongation factor P
VISTSDLHKGVTILLDGELQKLLDYQHVKQGRGSAFVRIQMRNLRTGSQTERTFQAGERFNDVRLDRHTMQYLYHDGDQYQFMNTETFDQFPIPADILGDAIYYMRENDSIDVLFYGDEPIDVDLPTSVNLKIEQTDPGIRGDRATSGNKPATMETGLVVNVPLHISSGDVIKVDTRTGEYLGKVN